MFTHSRHGGTIKTSTEHGSLRTRSLPEVAPVPRLQERIGGTREVPPCAMVKSGHG